MMLAALAITPVTQIPLLLASSGLGWEIVIGVALIVQLACAGAAGTTQRSIRQIITAPRMQARMQAVSTWLTAGARPVGALLAGALGTWAGVRAALVVGACLLIVPLLVLALSPLRGLRQMPDAPPELEEPAPAEEPPRAGPPPQVRALERHPPQTFTVRARRTEARHDRAEHRGHNAKARCPRLPRSSEAHHHSAVPHQDRRGHPVRGRGRRPG
ncbi:hypothetical protein ACFVYE_33465 [Streptomyces sp. NPDC058239]|uniref:hypothetical protein n=1 Tax=unclassified Streptomyces TaxID=2593676 RepID=UPI00365DB610